VQVWVNEFILLETNEVVPVLLCRSNINYRSIISLVFINDRHYTITMRQRHISKRKLWKILTAEPPQQISLSQAITSVYSERETPQDEWLKGYWRWKKQTQS
jgi:hypothetical protein